MNIKLIFPPAYNSQLCCLPTEMATLLPLVRKHGHSVEQDNLTVKWYYHRFLKKKTEIDLDIFKNISAVEKFLQDHFVDDIDQAVNELLALLDHGSNDLYKFILRNNKQIATALCISKKLKELTGSIVVFGGPFPQTISDELEERFPFIDHVIKGEGENAFIDLLAGIDAHEKTERAVISAQPIDLNTLPVPEYDPLTIRVYKSINVFYLPYETIRGCPSRCAFCTSGTGEKIRFKSPLKICSDLEVLRDKYDAHLFHFSSSSINFSKRFLDELLDLMIEKKLNVHWSSYAIPNPILTDPALVRRMKEAGCIKLKFGIESGSDEMLSLLNKRCSADITQEVLKTVYSEGIYTYASFVHSYLYEPKREHLKTLRYIKMNGRYISMARPCKFVLHWGSPIYQDPQKFGVRIRPHKNRIFGDAEVNPFDEISGLSWEEKQREQEQRHEEILALADSCNIFTEKGMVRNGKALLSHKLWLELQGLI